MDKRLSQEQIDKRNADREQRRKTMQYLDAAHAIQSGVLQMQHVEAQQGKCENESSTGGKHLRTGVNIAMCNHAALVQLLIDKGLFTREEHAEAIRLAAIREVESYENQLQAHFGVLITLL